jgi:hypothetical protein
VEIAFNILLIVVAYYYSTLLEWLIHKYILHGLGKNKNSWFSFHWHTHHKMCRKHNNKDTNYESGFSHSSIKKEIIGLIGLTVIHSPIIFASPVFFISLAACAARYFYIHKKSHTDIEWGKRHVPWHWDHHIGKDQNVNWGVTSEFWDLIIGTRVEAHEQQEQSKKI